MDNAKDNAVAMSTYLCDCFIIPFIMKLGCGSPSWTRTSDKVINSHPLYQLSYRGLWWSWQESNLLPLPCKGSALPDELQPRGATDWNRTNDLKFTKLLLYHLSYSSIKKGEKWEQQMNPQMSRFKQGSNVKKQIWYLMSFSECKKGERPNKKQIFFFYPWLFKLI